MFARILPVTLLTLLIGCKGCKDKGDDTSVDLDDTSDSGMQDLDGDGVPASDDCDDNDANVTYGSTWYEDADADGYGDEGSAETACEQPSGYSEYGGDCDDADPAYNPGAEESCTELVDYNCDGSVGYEDADGDDVPACEDCDDANPDASPYGVEVCDDVDNDCDGSIDEEAADSGTWYTDGDGDGYGVDGTGIIDCDQPSGTAAVGGDCDDADAAYNPGALEEDCADPNDYNCDGSVGYTDGDGDGVPACEDCDDADAAQYPGAVELCNSEDDDCDTEIDEDASGASTWYTDADADGYGDDTLTSTSCTQPDGTSAYGGDCDDADSAYNPGATEDDCADPNDYNCDGSVGYTDGDGDGYAACEECDDTDATENPGALEICDGDDDDCDGTVDEDDAYDASTWYADADSDGYGDATSSTAACSAPDGFVADSTDCDDLSEVVYPTAPELCDGEDNDCDDLIDEDSAEATDWYADADGDGYGDASSTVHSCDPGSGYSADSTDCDDTNSTEYPGADEVCDGDDDDCDGSIDESDATDASTWYTDGDGDGYGLDSSTTTACEQPSGYAAYGGDCDDTDTAYNPGAIEDDCSDPADYNCDGSVGYTDSDGDGFAACEECDDTDGDINPDASEVCDDVDNDCDGSVDESGAGGGSTWYADGDGDGYGDPETTVDSCAAPTGYVATGTDCDDGDSSVHPDGVEYCDGVDNDCDGSTDEDEAFDASTWYADSDGDGFGDASTTTEACSVPSGYVTDSTDCDDTDEDTNPDGVEVCDDVDNDCNGTVDDDATDATTWYRDADSDTYGDDSTVAVACDRPARYRRRGGDCDDTNSAINPAATEICDDLDNDCDGSVDEAGAGGSTSWYADDDSDGFGDPYASTSACDAPAGYVDDDTDCDDTDGDINPDATEVCDGVDNDCDGSVDDGAGDSTVWYADDDGDGFGDPVDNVSACDAPTGYVDDNSDCDDEDDAINPDAVEICDGHDNDCDGSTDGSDAVDQSTWYYDADDDTWGSDARTTTSCDAPSGYVSRGDDCDDTDPAYNPGATEDDCSDPNDYNCDGSVAYSDADDDGWAACEDCDDGDSSEYPGANELCDGDDDDCDGSVDESDAVDESTWYRDSDGDTYGDPSRTRDACDAPTGYVADDTDCDDSARGTHPGATETCDDADNDCDGSVDEGASDSTTWYADGDGDGYGDADDSTDACDAPSGYVDDDTDCDDADPDEYPGADELCDGDDDDCDGTVDEASAVDATTWYADTDSDSFGDPSVSRRACDMPSGYVDDDQDCDDGNDEVNPDASERCNGIDDDCDGTVDESSAIDADPWYTDGDEDGYGDPSDATVSCEAPDGTVSNDDDCDDSRANVNPGEDEVCDDLDNDCDDLVDEDAVDATSWYTDTDGDGYGDDATEVVSCDAPSGSVAFGGDCDEGDTDINPGIVDLCDGVDENCDGVIDDGVVAGKFLMSADTTEGAILSVNVDDASATKVSDLATSPNIPSVAVSDDGTAYIYSSGNLYTFDACTGTSTLVGSTGLGSATICGLSFDGDGNLYGLNRTGRNLIKFDTSTGTATSVGALGFRIGTCGMSYDCTNDRLMGVDGSTNSLFTVNKSTGTASGFVAVSFSFTSAGMEYDPRTQSFLVSTSTSLYDVDYSSGASTLVGTVSPASNVDDLVFYPECTP